MLRPERDLGRDLSDGSRHRCHDDPREHRHRVAPGYDQHWSAAWVEEEFSGTYKDLILGTILNELATLLPPDRRRLLDVGAHAGRFMHLAQARGWQVEDSFARVLAPEGSG